MAVGHAGDEKRGYGMFAIEERCSPDAIGFCGIVHPGGQPQPEVKYALLRSHWNRGIATEAVTGLISYGAGIHRMSTLMATAAPANLASHRVLLKSGMHRAELRSNDDGSNTQVFRWQTASNAA